LGSCSASLAALGRKVVRCSQTRSRDKKWGQTGKPTSHQLEANTHTIATMGKPSPPGKYLKKQKTNVPWKNCTCWTTIDDILQAFFIEFFGPFLSVDIRSFFRGVSSKLELWWFLEDESRRAVVIFLFLLETGLFPSWCVNWKCGWGLCLQKCFNHLTKTKLGGGLHFFVFTPTWGDDPIWRIFLRWVETTNQTWADHGANLRKFFNNWFELCLGQKLSKMNNTSVEETFFFSFPCGTTSCRVFYRPGWCWEFLNWTTGWDPTLVGVLVPLQSLTAVPAKHEGVSK